MKKSGTTEGLLYVSGSKRHGVLAVGSLGAILHSKDGGKIWMVRKSMLHERELDVAGGCTRPRESPGAEPRHVPDLPAGAW